MVNKAGNAGTYAETATVRYLKVTLESRVDRRRPNGRFDRGDITGVDDLAFEVKAGKTPCFPEWMRETEAERINAGADYGVLVHKPVGVGAKSTRLWTAAMDEDAFGALVVQSQIGEKLFRMKRKVRGEDDVRSALKWARVESAGGPAAVLFETNKNLPNYVAMYLEDMVDLLKRAGYGTPREETGS